MKGEKLYYKKKDKSSIKWASVSECKNKCFVKYDYNTDSLDCRYDYKCKYCGNKTETYELWLEGKIFSKLFVCKECRYIDNDKKIIDNCCDGSISIELFI